VVSRRGMIVTRVVASALSDLSAAAEPAVVVQPLVGVEGRRTAGVAPQSRRATQSCSRGSARQIVDRITFEAHIVETGTQSYRLPSSQHKPAKSPTAPGCLRCPAWKLVGERAKPITGGCLGILRSAHERRVMATRSGDLRIVAVASHRQRQLSAGWGGGDGDEQQIDPLIIGAKDPDQATTRNPEPVHGDPSAAGQPDAARSAVPSGHVQPDPTDPGAPGSHFLTQRDELDGGICRPWPPRPVQSTPGGTTRL
jgi:hypothetical protein